MPDIAIVWNPSLGYGDFAMAGADLLTGQDLATAALISAFTERAADPSDDLPTGVTDLRGWWGDDPNDPMGSKIWELMAASATDVPQRAKTYLQDCWAWFITDGVAASIEVTVEWVSAGVLGCRGVFVRPDGTTASVQFDWAWAELS